MARTVRYAKLETRESRLRLKKEVRHFSPIAHNAALVYRRGRGVKSVWQVRVRRDNGEYKFARIGTPDDYEDADGAEIFDYWQAAEKARKRAEHVAREIRPEEAADEADVAPEDMTVTDAFDAYFEHQRAKAKARNVRAAEQAYRNYIKNPFGHLLVAELTQHKVQRWHDGMVAEVDGSLPDDEQAEQQRKRQNTANRKLTILKAGLSFAWNGAPSVAEAWKSVKPFRKVDPPEQPWLQTRKEAKRLLRHVPAEFRPMAQAALLTGCRAGELRTLKVADVNFRTGVLTVRGTDAKSGKARHIPLTEDGAAFFEEHTAGKTHSALILTRANGDAWKHGDQARPMAEANEKAKIDPPVSLHGLRRTYGSWLALEGVPLQVIQKVLGHSSITLTEKHYAYLIPDHVAEVIRANLPSLDIKSKIKQLVVVR